MDPPGVMWPDSGSGFEPSTYSPAGSELQQARLLANAQWHRAHPTPTFAWANPGIKMLAIIAGFFVAVFLIAVLTALL